MPSLRGSALRLFTVQGSWNYERMLGVGLGFVTEPLLRDLPGGPRGPAYRSALARATGYFNAHPYLVGLAAGALARAEHDGLPAAQIDRLRTALLGPLGSVGDRLVWAGTLPAAVGVGLALSATAPVGVGAAVLLALHNAVHLTLRLWSLRAGWRLGPRIARALGSPVVSRALGVAGPAAALSVGAALPVVGAWLTRDFDAGARLAVVFVFVAALVVVRWLAPRFGAVRFGLLAAALALGAELL
jgi:mannose/fructose/N-acetylgalactosamine-specific phosphotransferase system component IID